MRSERRVGWAGARRQGGVADQRPHPWGRGLALALLLAGLGGPVLAALPPTVVLVSGEDEYQAEVTLAGFRRELQTNGGFEAIHLERRSPSDLPGLEVLRRADLLILFARRLTLPPEQLDRFKEYFQSGRPVIGLRTASHAFQNWLEFDPVVLGGHYQGHLGNDLVATARVVPEAAAHPILQGVGSGFVTGGSLYRNTPLGSNTTVLLEATVLGSPPEPVAWTHAYRGARVFYTSLGHPKDFAEPSFRRMLRNAVHWALHLPSAPPGPTAAHPVPPRRVAVEEFDQLRLRGGCGVLDVRSPREFSDGHVPGATNLNVLSPDFDQQVRGLDRSRTWLVYCARGGRSAMAVQRMESLRFRELVDFAGGWAVWQRAGKPVEK